MVGIIIGAGIFGLPAAFSLVGFIPATILFFVLATVVTLTHLILAELLLATRERHRLAGLALRGLGPVAYQIIGITYPLAIIGANYAYLVLGGEFLNLMAGAIGITLPVGAWQLLFWAGGVLTVLFGITFIAKVEGVLSTAKMFVLLVVLFIVLPKIDLALVPTGVWGSWYLPFGIILFSLSGLSGVGEVIEIAGRRRRDALAAVAGGTVLSAVLCWMFGAGVFLASHGYPIRDAADLVSVLPQGIGLIVPVLGFLAVTTAYLITAEDLRVMFATDLKWKPAVASLVALLAPLCLLAVLSRNFLTTLSFVGAVLIGINGFTVCALGYKAMYRRRDHFWHLAGTIGCALLMGVYSFGIFQQLFTRQVL